MMRTCKVSDCKWLVLLLMLSCAGRVKAELWDVLGPEGGDARSLSYNPRQPDQVFLGTSTGSLFKSSDGGRSWVRCAHLGTGDDYVLDQITIDPNNPNLVFVSAWSVNDKKRGDLFRSSDGGKTWQAISGMHGKSVRAFAISASDSRILIAGALDGVYRSQDAGDTWERISDVGQAEIKNVESIAVDPKDPNVIYAGTWHLAWKTLNGGASWRHINKGMIDDSDVFSIIVDASNPLVVYASACSGIYKSDDAGEIFHRVQGIPFSARRTRILKQVPSAPNTVYAGTTEGLWKTMDAGKTWKRMSDPQIVVNDVQLDPRNPNRVLLATDRAGVLISEDGARSFIASNRGYTHRYVTTVVRDQNDPDLIFAGVANDREWGGVFSFSLGARKWQQKSAGLGGRDVLALAQADSGALVAGTNHGMFLLDRGAKAWRPISTVANDNARLISIREDQRKYPGGNVPNSLATATISAVDVTTRQWFAATSSGLFVSSNEGRTWTGGPVLGQSDFTSVTTTGEIVVLSTRTKVLISANRGMDWQPANLAAKVTSIRGVAATPTGEIFLASREGAFRSSDAGGSWEKLVSGLPDHDISSISYDPSAQRLLATSLLTGLVFESTDGGHSWRAGPDSGYPMRRISVLRGRFIAVTPFDGVIVQP
jgi:photosystem II stability/assembly factor-like uncharacterized protein